MSKKTSKPAVDPTVSELFDLSPREPLLAYERAEKILESGTTDTYSLLMLQQRSLEAIVSDLDEHGAQNEHLYGDLPLKHFETLLKDLRAN